MNDFEKLRLKWQDQRELNPSKEDFDAVLNRINDIKKKQRITNVVLSATILVLVFFFFYISGYKNSKVTVGLSLMILSLAIRIGIEMRSIYRLKKINVMLEGIRFKEKLMEYYSNRKRVHFFITPVIVLTYILGFRMLLPSFKSSLSSGFYTYIVISSIVILLVLGTFIALQIKKELNKLKSLKATG
ncbi:hypothetical protein [Costertonia aggregata]|uniref:DUF3278 domain-containing protein n=1 Tax=Costertonia aggregata TaxID=343403 RepID=A0A7H9AP27_9FLAO|nr:hypothetical protein [Costertonia aggregata]QLG45198.1 hypothetical protein HYG79_07495 [Costertonia aggregata]